ncbi:hypothetical protein BV898_06652 [Hypsibius exemplaris]|uniref:Uncharacterized protein n=1 Tax=Hypsibius exemplaris TaxID=2072580 RepID=A0A1W0WVP7_HYPEX|nr:hypothetical protein BV898_06652 [Hypsibius exemplaris]
MTESEPISYDKLATVLVKEPKNNRFLRQFAFARQGKGGSTGLAAPSETEVRKFVALFAAGHCLVAAAGVIALSVFGITITGALLTAWECFCTLVGIAGFAWIRSKLPAYLRSTNQTFAQLYEGTIRPVVKIFLYIMIGSLVLCIATIIHGAVVLTQMQSQSQQSYFYYGFVNFLYTGLGAGNLIVGVLGLVITCYCLKRLLDFYRSGSTMGSSGADDEPINQSSGALNAETVKQSMGSVEQLAVTDLTEYAASLQPHYEVSSRSTSQGSDQTFIEYSSEKSQPTRNLYRTELIFYRGEWETWRIFWFPRTSETAPESLFNLSSGGRKRNCTLFSNHPSPNEEHESVVNSIAGGYMDSKLVAVLDRNGNSYFRNIGSLYFKDHKGGRNSADLNYEAVNRVRRNPKLCEPNVSIEIGNSQQMRGPRGLEEKAILYTHKDSPVPIGIFVDLPYSHFAPENYCTILYKEKLKDESKTRTFPCPFPVGPLR